MNRLLRDLRRLWDMDGFAVYDAILSVAYPLLCGAEDALARLRLIDPEDGDDRRP